MVLFFLIIIQENIFLKDVGTSEHECVYCLREDTLRRVRKLFVIESVNYGSLSFIGYLFKK